MLQSISDLWRGLCFQMCNRSQSPSWNVYVLHMSEVSTKGSVLDLQVLNSRKHTGPGNSQGLNLSYSVSARKPISSRPSSDWLIPLSLAQLDWQAHRHWFLPLCHGMGHRYLVSEIEGMIFSLPCRHFVQVTICAGHLMWHEDPENMFEYSLQLCIFWRSHVKIWQWIFTEYIYN